MSKFPKNRLFEPDFAQIEHLKLDSKPENVKIVPKNRLFELEFAEIEHFIAFSKLCRFSAFTSLFSSLNSDSKVDSNP